MFQDKLFFCFGDYRGRKRRYRIFMVNTLEKAHKVAETLGYKVLADETYKCAGIHDMEERIAASILLAIHVKLHGIENTVSCIRRNKNDAEQLKRHFMTSDMSLYFPKILDQPVKKCGTPEFSLVSNRRKHPWMVDYIIREMKAAGLLQEKPKTMQMRVVKPNRAVFECDEPMRFDDTKD